MIFLIIFIAVLLLAIFLYLQNNLIDVTKYRLKSDNIINRIKIVQLSDLHSKSSEKILSVTKNQKPDIIVITGDYINDKCKNKDKMLEFGKKLVEVCPVYYITGNHERRLENFDELMEELRKIGFTVLLNEIATDRTNDNLIQILGLDENQANFEDYKARKNGTFIYKDMSPYFNRLDTKSGYKIVLSHFPENFRAVAENNYEKYDFDLQLSGHAHGGQFKLPFIGPVFSPGQGLFPKYAQGEHGDRPKLIVSRGIGNAEFPFRLFNHPEINVITISKKI